MKAMRTLIQITRADFLERSRRFSFLVCLGVTIYSAYLFVPPHDANYLSISVGTFRGVYNSAWVAASLAAMSAVVLSLFGFYLIKDTLYRDRMTGVGQIIATTSLRPWAYLAGKALSNFVFLGAMVGVIWVATIPIQLLRGESTEIDIAAATLPYALMTLPVMAVVAALGVLFETVRWLRGTLGNVVYFFVWGVGFNLGRLAPGAGNQFDLLGLTPLYESFANTCTLAYSACEGALDQVAAAIQPLPPGKHVEMFVWAGLEWTATIIGIRLFWVGVAVILVGVAACLFGRFESALTSPGREAGMRKPTVQPEGMVDGPRPTLRDRLGSITARIPVGRSLIGSEVKLMITGISPWWLIVAVGLSVAGFLVPAPVARAWLLPVAWIWPLPLWSSMGSREAKWRTDRILFSVPRALSRQLPSCWAAGVVISIVTGLGPLIRMSLDADWAGVTGGIVGALFIPSLALALGVWSSGERLFEIIYLIMWYVGPIEKLPLFDFTAAGGKASPLLYAVVTGGLLTAAVIGRRRAVYG